jgi:hypothetical protein
VPAALCCCSSIILFKYFDCASIRSCRWRCTWCNPSRCQEEAPAVFLELYKQAHKNKKKQHSQYKVNANGALTCSSRLQDKKLTSSCSWSRFCTSICICKASESTTCTPLCKKFHHKNTHPWLFF